jgi:UDP-N-acetylglucosamine 4,6-dehydratase|tara:strand:+ start:2860 stop:3843 length:984 start_codon:yes stop_codon:yes gene_type:complete
LFKGLKICITGGTGSLGDALTERLLKTDVEVIRIFSRDEWKQTEMQSKYKDNRLRFLIGDVRDSKRLDRAFEDIDIVIHTAALKHVPVTEYNPFEAVKTNVNGTQNVIDACLINNVKQALAIGTDKAVSPFNTYGATKLLMERLFISANQYKGKHRTKFSCVRYGNVLGSRGSVVSVFMKQIEDNKKITITDPTMTRFTITMNQALDIIFRALKNGKGGEVFVPKLEAYRLGDLKDAIVELLNAENKTEIISVRVGEKYHELLISVDELRNTFETKEDYILIDKINNFANINKNIKISQLKNAYSSDKVKILSKNELKSMLIKEKII